MIITDRFQPLPTYHPSSGVKQAVEEQTKTESVFKRIHQFFLGIRRSALYGECARITPIVNAAGTGFLHGMKLVNHILLSLPKDPTSSRSAFVPSPSSLRLLGRVKFAGGILSGICAVVNIVAQSIELGQEVTKRRMREGIDAALRIIEGMGDLGESVSACALGLSMAEVVSASAVLWATPLGIVSAALSLATVVWNARGIHQSAEIRSKLEQTEDKALAWLKAELQDGEHKDGDYFLDRHFGIISREKYAAQILHIINSDPTSRRDRAISKHKRATAKKELLEALKTRIDRKIISHKLAITSAIVGLVGMLLLFIPGIGPLILGVGLVAGAAIISLAKYIIEKRSVNALENKIDELCKFHRIPTIALPPFAQQLRA